MRLTCLVCLMVLGVVGSPTWGGESPADAAGTRRAANPQAIAEVAAGRETTARASWWGFDPEDATAALQAAINSGAKKLIVENLGSPWIVRKLELVSDQEIVFEKGVVVQAKRGEFLGKNDSLFTASGKRNITLTGHGATLKMWREDYDRPPYEHSEWRHVLCFYDCSNVRIEGLTLAESGGDGIYLGGTLNRDFVIRDVVCDRNYRQGMSVITAENLLVENCVFRDTGGTAPMAGVDFEPNRPNERLVNCVLRNCLAEGNRSIGFILYLKNLNAESTPVSIRFENCRTRDNQTGFHFTTGNGPKQAVRGSVEVVDCTFENDRIGGIVVEEKPAEGCRLRFVNCRVINAAANQANKAPILFFSMLGNTQDIGGVEFTDCFLQEALDRPAMMYVDGGGVNLIGVTGNLTIEREGNQTAYTLEQSQLDAWMPQRKHVRIPPFDPSGVRYVPVFPEGPGTLREISGVWLRGNAEYLLWAEAGQRAEFTVRTRTVGKVPPQDVVVTLVSPAGEEKRLADARPDEGTSYSFVPEMTGAWRIVCRSASAGIQLVSTTQRVCLYTRQPAFSFFATRGELFFWVPPGLELCAVRLAGANADERVKAALYNPSGQKMEEADDIASMHQFVIRRPPDAEGEVWSIHVGAPTKGVLEDFYLELQGIAPVLALQREALLRPQK